MKRIIGSLSVAAMVLMSASAYSQSGRTGLYLTAEDFAAGKVSYAADHHKVTPDVPFKHAKVKINNGNKTVYIDKSELFGYRDKQNQDFRFVNNAAYKIMDARYFPIYSREVEISKGKGRIKETQYFFSKANGQEVLPLTIGNLKQAFPENDKFHQLLDLQFRNNKELVWYDSYSNSFKLKDIFNQSI